MMLGMISTKYSSTSSSQLAHGHKLWLTVEVYSTIYLAYPIVLKIIFSNDILPLNFTLHCCVLGGVRAIGE